MLLTVITHGTASTPMNQFLSALVEGFVHIVPGGPDHVAFLIGLFLLAREFRPLVWQVTVFTLAHSLSLGLVLLEVVALPARAVEIAVALSIAAIAAECLSGDPRCRSRTLFDRLRSGSLVAFGLLHGAAFAHTFPDVSPQSREFIPALFGFNLGVELGQLIVVGTAFLVFSPVWDRPWYHRRVVMPVSLLLAFCGLTWAASRAAAIP
jgi:hypothetical protein